MNEKQTLPHIADSQATQLIMKLFENSKEHVEEIVDDLPMVYAVISAEAEIVRANRDSGTLFDKPFEELIGQPFNSIFHQADWQMFGEALRLTAETGKKAELNLPVWRKGKQFFYTWTLVRLDRVATRTLVAVIGQDITSLERNTRRIEKLMRLFDRLVRTSQKMMDGQTLEQAIAISLNTALSELEFAQVQSARFEFSLSNRKEQLAAAHGQAKGMRLNVEWEGSSVGQLTLDKEALEDPELLTFIKLLGQSTYLILSHLSFQNEMQQKVELGSREIAELNAGLNSLLNSLTEGYCVFDIEGLCLPISSRRMREFYGSDPKGLFLADVLNVEPALRESFGDWLTVLKGQQLPFEDLAQLCPLKWWEPPGRNRKIEVRFHPVLNDSKTTVGIALVATDRTEQLIAESNAALETEKSFTILRIIENLSGFAESWNAISQFIEEYDTRTLDHENTIRFVHTHKSSFSFFGWDEMATNLNSFERDFDSASKTKLSEWRQIFAKTRDDFAEKFPQLLDILIKNNKHMNVTTQEELVYELASSAKDLASLQRNLSSQFLFFEARILFEPLFARLHHRAAELGVSVEVSYSDDGRPIYARAYRSLLASLEHLFNNIVDHGFANYAEIGKSGKVEVRVEHQDKCLVIMVADNGVGIDEVRLLKKAESQGRSLSPAESKNPSLLVFAAGFSTLDIANEKAGRGVGMEVVAFEVGKVGGAIDVITAPKKGAKFVLRLPLQAPEF